MNTNTSLVTDTSVAVSELSVDAYRDVISAHVDNDLAGHTSVRLHLVSFLEQTGHLVANASLRMRLTDSTGVAGAYALPALVQPGTFPPVGSAPIILRSPASTTAVVDGFVIFTVYVASSLAFSYQWQKNGNSIFGATEATYTIPNLQLSDAGSYQVIVNNSIGQAISNAATLTVTSI